MTHTHTHSCIDSECVIRSPETDPQRFYWEALPEEFHRDVEQAGLDMGRS